MEAILSSINQLSANLVAELEQSDLKTIEAYMEQRDRLFVELQEHVPTPEEKRQLQPLVKQLQKQDALILQRLAHLRNEAKQELNKLNLGKRSKSMYESASYSDDSLFFDTKR